MKKAYFNWSSGKDSALALYKILQKKEYSVEKLITTINQDVNRVSMHGLDEKLLEKQVEALQIPLEKIYFPANLSMETYTQKMKNITSRLKSEGFEYSIFGDILLEDLRQYRDEKLSEARIKGVYPLWKRNTKEVLKEFLDLGFKAITVCVDANILGKEFVGRVIDEQFISELPKNVDVCGENGEFHTFCFEGAIFERPINFEIGEKVLKTHTYKEENSCISTNYDTSKSYDSGFWYCDLQF